ncbi:hypothetical protein AAG570_002816 [Ranatra chinensis]|uniref:Uncharacterized protein n=1 Tax=Ranatra chinensis TaxID=642074 RepID=A0ABD0Y4Z9_9HEMI
MDSTVGPRFNYKSSWNCNGDLRSYVTFGNNTEKLNILWPSEGFQARTNGRTELGLLVQLESCIQLSKADKDVPCTLSIVLEDSSTQITKISVVSEARNIEVYGLHEEYITTVRSENIDEFEGMVVNLMETDVSPVPEIMLKFIGIKEPDTMWLYGIRLIVGSFSKPTVTTSRVNYEAVEERLRMARIPITEKAERCKRFLRQYTEMTNSCAAGRRPPDPATFIHLMDEARSRRSEVERSVSDLDEERSTTNHNPLSSGGKEIQDLKSYIEFSLEKLEGRLTQYIDDKLRQLEERQNKMMESIMQVVLGQAPKTPDSLVDN